MKAPRIDALVLAAGRSLRAGGPNKLLLPWQHKAVVVHAVDAALCSSVRAVHVVTGHDPAPLHQVLHARPVHWIHNPDYASGISTSISAGVRELAPDLDGVVLCLGDMPWVRSQQIDRLIDGFDPCGSCRDVREQARPPGAVSAGVVWRAVRLDRRRSGALSF